jgi:DNA-binding transcriptional MocR family regulator
MRRDLGPIAWAVLECAAARTVEQHRETVSYISVRGVADELGLAKDTVARALRRLADEQLVAYVPARTHEGRFGPSHYRLSIPPDVFVHAAAVPLSEAPRSKPSRRARPSRPAQLSLLEAPSAGF